MSAPAESRSVCLLGGSGFVGHALAEQLTKRGWFVRVLTRTRQKARDLLVLPTLEVAVADPHDDAALARQFEGVDVVVNLIATLHESRRERFESVHTELPRKVANACRAAGVRRLVHVSALGSSETAPSRYLRTRAAGDRAVRESGEGLDVTIVRPSVIYGPGDRFTNLFASLARLLPVLPLACPKARFQPIWVEDVARAITIALGRSEAAGATFNLCGPRVYTLEDVAAFVAGLTGHDPLILPLPDGLAKLQATMLEFLPGSLLTRDNLLSMSVDNICDGPFPRLFGFQPAAMEAIVPEYIAEDTPKGRYRFYRYRAGR